MVGQKKIHRMVQSEDDEIEIISYVSCLPYSISLPEWGKPENAVKMLQGLSRFLKTGYAILPNDANGLFKKGDEIEPIRNSPTPPYFLIANNGLKYFKNKDVILAYDGVMLEIHSFMNAIDIDNIINKIEKVREIHFSAADDFYKRITLNLQETEDIMLNTEYLTTFIVLGKFNTAIVESLTKADFEIFETFIAKNGEISLISTNTRVPYIVVIDSKYLKKAVYGLEAIIIADRGIDYLRKSIFYSEIMPSFYEDIFIDERVKFLRPLLKSTLSKKLSDAEILMRDLKITSDLEFEHITNDLFGVLSVNSYFEGIKNFYSEDKMIKWTFPDINKMVSTYDKLLNRLANSITQTLSDLRTIRQHESELIAQNQQSFIILITLLFGLASIAISIALR